MRQLLVECSDPGIIVSLAEEFENILRHASRTLRAQQLQRALSKWRFYITLIWQNV